tara:strand:+ start:65608 stop:65940 length:333 start_codon:yes stop_codon:yes gene_type:complete
LPSQASPRGIIHIIESIQYFTGEHGFTFEYLSQIRQQPHAQARGGLLGFGYKGYSGHTSAVWPITANNIGNRQQRLPYVGVAVLDTIRHIRPCVGESIHNLQCPAFQAIP